MYNWDMQTPAPVLLERQYISKALGCTQPYACYLPADHRAHADKRYPVLVMLHGSGCDHTSWSRMTRIGVYLSNYDIVTIFPFGKEGWYTNGINFDGESRFEDDIVLDLAAETMRATPALPAGRHWAVAGMSMGGYGAIRLALKFPEMFSCAVSHGGALDRMMRGDVHPVFGDPVQNAVFRKEQSPIWLVEQLMCRFPVQRPNLFLDCGASDPLLEVNRSFSNHLRFLGYHHRYTEASGHHTWPYWNRAFRTVLPDLAAQIGAARNEQRGSCHGFGVGY